jgi:hypothetical protein
VCGYMSDQGEVVGAAGGGYGVGLVTFAGGRGFVTYKNLAGADARTIETLVAETVAHYRRDPRIDWIEWKTRGHDHAPGRTKLCSTTRSPRTNLSRS